MLNKLKLTLSILFFTLFVLSFPAISEASNVSVWWPVDGVTLEGTQPFKALLENSGLDTYKMYWQVDNGQLNEMPNNMTDYPHKEVSVDLSGWKWNNAGPYVVKFVAKDLAGNTIGEKSVNIFTKVTTTTVTPTVNTSTPPTTTAPTTSTTNSTPTPTTGTPFTPLTSTPTITTNPSTTVSAVPTTATQTVWWPTNDVVITGSQPFKAVVDGMSLRSYNMYWQVDGGALNRMYNSNVDGPHKEAMVNVSGWNWKGLGPYVLTFVSKDRYGKVIAKKSVNIYTGTPTTVVTNPIVTNSPVVTNPTVPTTTTPVVTNPPTTTTPPPTTVTQQGNPLSNLSFYTNPNSNARRQANEWKTSRPNDALEMEKIASQPEARWLGDWNSDIYTDTKNYVDQAANSGKTPVMIAYNIPGRDCGNYSRGGATSADAYRQWIKGMANGIGNRSAVVILEPDALALTDCLSQTDKDLRFSLVSEAISILKANSGTIVYVDAGNSNWIGATDMAARLKSAGIEKANGFAVNVSNYYWTQDNVNFGNTLSGLVGNKHFVVDTSRNGLGSNGGEWCNPSGRALGPKVTTNTGNSLVDGYLWLKNPGESDGNCNGGPNAGVWWPEYALGLAQRAQY